MSQRLLPGLLALSLVTSAPLCNEAGAADFTSNDYVAAPAGTNLALLYYDFSAANKYNNTLTGTVDKNTHLITNVGVFRYVYYMETHGIEYTAELLVPFGSVSGGKIGGGRLDDTFGAGDPSILSTVWLLRNPRKKQYLGLTFYETFPLGSYDSKRPISFGANRFQQDVQLVYMQALGHHFSTDIGGDYIWYGSNNDPGGPGGKLKQKSTWSAEYWLNYDITPTSFAAVGWEGNFGGTKTLNGALTGQKTEFQEVRATYAFRTSPTFQVAAKVFHDFATVGGFNNDVGFEIRLCQAW